MRRGYSLVELLITLTVVAVLAGIAIARFSQSKERSYQAAMQSDLRTLITAMEMYRSDSARYTTDLARLQLVRASAGVHLTIDAADVSSWQATARHDATARTCVARGGVAFTGANAGEVSCP